ncbi:MAG: class I SAM-dependent methyltransferase [Dongiaceae bacterium]
MAGGNQSVEAHYGRSTAARLVDALLARFNGDRPIGVSELSTVDQLHSRGAAATRALARLAGLSSGEIVLDVGSGMGGPARLMAAEFGVRVIGIDLTDSFCEAARALSARVGMAARVEFLKASALALPLANASVDVAWTQHVAMNIADKPRLYDELYRVLRAGGRLAIHEIFTGAESPCHFPVPWARDAGSSFLETAAELRRRLAARFEPVAWQDATMDTITWARETQAKRRMLPKDAPAPIPALIFGSDFDRMADNLLRNLEERRLSVVEAVFRKR